MSHTELLPDGAQGPEQRSRAAADEREDHRARRGRQFPQLLREPVSLAVVAVATSNFVALLGGDAGLLPAVVAFAAYALAVGAATYYAAGVEVAGGWARLHLVVTLGLLTVMAVGLAVNTVLPLVGIDEPLRPSCMLPALDLAFAALLLLGRNRWPVGSPRWPSAQAARRALPLLVPFSLPVAAVCGAIALDNGMPNHLAVATLTGCLLVVAVLLHQGGRIPVAATNASLYAVSLALLLMTSMRGTHATGHDVQQETLVFSLTAAGWHWDPSALASAYNACLSITILPTVVSGVFGVPDVQVYKLVFQLLFAMLPVTVAMLATRLSSRRRVGVVAAVLFAAFPTFFADMPMLNRQEIAFLMVGGMLLLVMCGPPVPSRRQAALFAVLGVGAVVSHYSTTYLLLLQSFIAVVVVLVFRVLRARRNAGHPHGGTSPAVSGISWPALVVIALAGLVWTGPVTHSGSSASTVAHETWRALTGEYEGGLGSGDTKSSLLGGDPPTPQEWVTAYEQSLVSQLAEDQYPRDLIEKFSLVPSDPTVAPLTPVGRSLEAAGVTVFDLNDAVRSGSAVALQLLVALGVTYLLFLQWRRPLSGGASDVLALNVAGMALLLVMVLLPFLTADYGLLRAFQQFFILLSFPVVVALDLIAGTAGWTARRLSGTRGAWFPAVGRGGTASCVTAGAFFICSTGLLATVTGGYLPQLHLASAGEYYEQHYVYESEMAAAFWLRSDAGRGAVVQSSVQPVDGTLGPVLLADGHELLSDIAPAAVRRDGFVLLGPTTTRGKAFTVYDNVALQYVYPLQFLEESKDRVYSGGGTEVYR